MADPFDINKILIGPQQPNLGIPTRRNGASTAGSPSFEEVLQQTQGMDGTLKFSAHARTRIQSRQIAIAPSDIKRIEGALQKVAAKGGRESLVLVDQTAYVVSVPNRTVITVVDKDNLQQNVFTNIDSAVIA